MADHWSNVDYGACSACGGTGKTGAARQAADLADLSGEDQREAFAAMDVEARSRLWESDKPLYDALTAREAAAGGFA